MKSSRLLIAGMACLCLVCTALFSGCSKSSDNPGNPCDAKSITLTSSVVNSSDACSPNGTVQATAGGSTGFTFSLNNGTFQAGNSFNNIAPGNHTLTVKDNEGCSKSISVTVGGGGTPGPLFGSVKALIQGTCAVPSCHSGSAPTGNINFTVDCNIVLQAARIKVRAVDQSGTPSQMPLPPLPPLSQADRDKITQWIAAGGKFTD